MKNVITYNNLYYFAYSNDKLCRQPIRGLVLDFFGLGTQVMYGEPTEKGREYAEKGIILLIPYNNPWAWMNQQAVKYTDDLTDILFQHYELPETLPIVSSGGSMGGLSALVYAVYAKRTPAACVVNCPVCDLPRHFTERPDLPRTLYSAFCSYETETLDDALKTASPCHLITQMPDIPYTVFHCDKDQDVSKSLHSDRFVAEMRNQHKNITYHAVPGRGHCELTDEMAEKYYAAIVSAISQ